MAFQFSLAAVLRFRQSLERQQEILFREAAQRMAGVRREIDAVGSLVTEMAAQEAGALKAGVSAAELHFAMLRRAVLLGRRKQLEKDLSGAEALCSARNLELQRARQQREVVEHVAGPNCASSNSGRLGERDDQVIREGTLLRRSVRRRAVPVLHPRFQQDFLRKFRLSRIGLPSMSQRLTSCTFSLQAFRNAR